MSLDFFIELFPQLIEPAWITISLWVISTTIGLFAAAIIGTLATSESRVLRWPATTFLTVIRGTPLLVQIYILYYGVGSLLTQLPGMRSTFLWPIIREGYWYALLALVISAAAYMGAVVGGAIRTLPKGEIEAANSLGLTRPLIWLLIVLPRAFRIALPALGGESINLLKSTALASTITVMDLLGMANYIRMQSFRVYEPLLAVAIVYVLLTLILTRGMAWVERNYEH